jgi:sec-independent protein translocase protein TatC
LAELIDRPVSDVDGDRGGDKLMTLVDHLSELRRRLVVAAVAVVAGSVVGFILAPDVIRLLKEPIPGPLFFTQPGGALMLQLKLALMIGVALASPVVLYQLWAFISPGLTPRERRLARPWIPLALFLLLFGIGTAYAILPATASLLLQFQISGVVEPLITADAYFGFVTTLFLAFGLVMQFPIVLVLLSKVGIVSADQLRRNRRYAFLALVVVAVLVTPQDPFSTIIMSAVMYPIYELTIFLMRRSERGAGGEDG